MPLSRTRSTTSLAVAGAGHRDVSAGRRVARGVREQVVDHLREAHLVGFDFEPVRRDREREPVPRSSRSGRRRLDRFRHDARELDRFLGEG